MVASEEMEYCLGVLQCVAKSSVVTEAMCFKFIPDVPKDAGSPKEFDKEVPNQEIGPEVRTPVEKRVEDCDGIFCDIKNVILELIANEKSKQDESFSKKGPKQENVPKPTAEEGQKPSKNDDAFKAVYYDSFDNTVEKLCNNVKFEDLKDKGEPVQGSEVCRDYTKCQKVKFDDLKDKEKTVQGSEVCTKRHSPYLLHSKDGNRYTVTGDCIVGRNSSCHLELKYASVSRRHASIRVDGNTFFIKALSDAQGLYLNERKIEGGKEVTLRNGDKIIMGKEKFEFVCVQAETREKKVFFFFLMLKLFDYCSWSPEHAFQQL